MNDTHPSTNLTLYSLNQYPILSTLCFLKAMALNGFPLQRYNQAFSKTLSLRAYNDSCSQLYEMSLLDAKLDSDELH
jgi:hypothetical protein